MNTAAGRIDVSEIMRQVREASSRAGNPAPEMDLSRLTAASTELREAIRRFGRMPPQPPTLRAKVGAFAVRLVRRVLFWQTEQIQALETAAAEAIEEDNRAIETLAGAVHRLWGLNSERAAAIEELQAQVAELASAMREIQARLSPHE